MAETNRTKTELLTLFADNTSGDISAQDGRDVIYSLFQPQHICTGRLTLESGVPISTSDQTAKTNIYFTPYNGNLVSLYDGTSWKLYEFTERTFALGTLTSGLPYDLYLYDNSGTLTLEATAWTNGTTRATALTTQNGVYVKTGVLTRRYLGTFYTTSTTTTEDSGVAAPAKRYLWNQYNRVLRPFFVMEPADSWTYDSTTIRAANNNANNRINLVVGQTGQMIDATIVEYANLSGTSDIAVMGFGEDSTTTFISDGNLGLFLPAVINAAVTTSTMARYVPLGAHFYSWNEKTGNIDAGFVFYGDAGLPGDLACGIKGLWAC